MPPVALPLFASTLVALGAIRLGAAWPLKEVDFAGEGNPTPTPAAVAGPSYMYEGCFVDSKSSRIMSSKTTLSTMSAEICFGICDDGVNNYFGTQYSRECWCGVDSDLTANGDMADDSECDRDCAGTTTDEKCGGFDRMSAYKMPIDPTPAPDIPTPAPTRALHPTPAPPTSSPTVAPTRPPVADPTPAPAPSAPTSSSYMFKGCFEDPPSSRLMNIKTIAIPMSAEICFGICDDGVNNCFGTQYSIECWCGVESDLTDGYVVHNSECDLDCAGTTTDEKCGGFNRMSAYKILSDPTYVGCYGDAQSPRAMPGAGRYSSSDMTNEFCWDRCSGLGYAYAGTQYGVECWCDDTFDTYGEVDACDYQCGGDSSQTCGGFNALSVYKL